MKKRKAFKWVGIAVFTVLAILIIAGAAFYLLELKPRIDVAMAIGRTFEAYDCDALELDLEDGQQIFLDISSETALSAAVYSENQIYDGLEFGYFDAGIWLNIPQVSEKYYLLPWTDDVYDMLDEGAFASILNLTDAQKQEVADALISLREELLAEDTFDFTPTFLNRLLGLTCLKADILDIYNNIDFKSVGRESITVDGESVHGKKYTADVPQEYVKRLLKTDGAGSVLNALGDILGDVYVEVYISQGELIYIDIDTTFLYMPSLDLNKLFAGDISVEDIGVCPAPLSGEIYFNSDNSMNIYAELTGNYTIEASFLLLPFESTATWGVDEENELNVLETGYLRLLLEAGKWQEAIS